MAAMLRRVRDVHRYGTRATGRSIHVGTRDHRLVGYRVPTEWAGMTMAEREIGSLAAFKRRARAGFLAGYGGFDCCVMGCVLCGGPMDLASQSGHVP